MPDNAASALSTALDRNRLNFSWLLKLRWSSIAGQIATILGVYGLLGLPVPLLPLFCIVGIEFASNVWCALFLRRTKAVHEWHLASLMAFDTVLLTALLYFTGGPFNPFSFLYLVNIALAAVVLHAQWTWMLVAFALFSFGLLPLVDYWELPLSNLSPEERVVVHQQGMWVAFGVTAGFIVHFLWRITGALSRREAELGVARRRAARQEQLASLATMAAGAAHELSTPLGTIALVAKELERSMGAASAETIEDVQLIRQEVARCRSILDQMAIGVGKSSDQTLESISVAKLLDAGVADVRARPNVEIEVAPDVASRPLRVPPTAVAQAIRSLVTNAQDASPASRPVRVSAAADGASLDITVADRGGGMSRDVLKHVGEPFFTTKEPGQGMGLGLFLTRAVAEGLGGALDIASDPGEGTRVVLSIPFPRENAHENDYQPASHADASIDTDR